MLHRPGGACHACPNSTPAIGISGSAVILVVDDEDDLRAFTVNLLRAHGYGVLEAQHGEAAIESLCKHAPDLVVLDLNMPIMDGREFCEAQQRLPDPQLAGVPVLLVTAPKATRAATPKT